MPIVERHADEAAFLWDQRGRAVRSLLFHRPDLFALDERLLANLEGLVLAGGKGTELALQALESALRITDHPDAELFVAAHVVGELRDNLALSRLIALAEREPRRERAIAEALAWLPAPSAHRVLFEMLVEGAPPVLQRIAILALEERRADPGPLLANAVSSDDAALRVIACRAAGHLGRSDLIPSLRLAAADPDADAAGWARWALGILGDRDGQMRLWETAATASSAASACADLAARADNLAETASRLSALAASEQTLPAALAGAAAAGDPANVPWVLDVMDLRPSFARGAAWAYAMITGVKIEPPLFLRGRPPPREGEEDVHHEELEQPEPDTWPPSPHDDLPRPVSSELRAHWDLVRPRFSEGQRYLGGNIPDIPSLQQTLRGGPQAFRTWAAMELRRASPLAQLFPAGAPGAIQAPLLSSMKV